MLHWSFPRWRGITSVLITLLLLLARAEDEGVEYGVDVSWPIHHSRVSTNYPWLPHNVGSGGNNLSPISTGLGKFRSSQYDNMVLQPLGDRQAVYDNFMNGCREYYITGPGSKTKHGRPQACDATERQRVSMSLSQPKSMQNYTTMGFQKIRCPPKVFDLISKFWQANQKTTKMEDWFVGNTYTNHWDAPSYLVSVEDGKLRGGGNHLKKAIWDAARSTIEEWTGQELTESSMYGIRIYQDGAILTPHVDRLPLVSSAIINVAQDVDEPWPLEVYAHDGKAYNVTMEPGDMVLYESHSVLHGRPFPLKGRFYANIFIHFEPDGHTLRHEQRMNGGDGKTVTAADVDAKYKDSVAKGHGGHEHVNHDFDEDVLVQNVAADGSGRLLPPYVVAGTSSERDWLEAHPDGWVDPQIEIKTQFATGSTMAHAAAQTGDVDTLKEIAADAEQRDWLTAEDRNGWQPIHEGARAGQTEVVEYLLRDINPDVVNERTQRGKGGTPLYWARKSNGDDHEVVKLLKKYGGIDLGPEL